MIRRQCGEKAGRIGRRTFLEQGAAGLAGLGLAGLIKAPAARAETEQKSRLAMVKHAGATDDEGTGNAEIVRRMVERAMLELTGKALAADA